MKPSSRAAVINVADALVLIEQAQGLLEKAAQALSPVRRGGDLCQRTGDERDRVLHLWHWINERKGRDGMTLDSEPEILSEKEEREKAERENLRRSGAR